MRLSFTSRFLIIPGTTLLAVSAALLAACGPKSEAKSSVNEAPSAAASKTGYHVTNKYTIGGDAGWDYIVVDSDNRRLYVTHYQKIEVLNADTGKSIGQITQTPGVHGIALVKSQGKGYTSNGKADTVSVIDLNTLKHVAEIKAGKKPDAIVYDSGTDRIIVS